MFLCRTQVDGSNPNEGNFKVAAKATDLYQISSGLYTMTLGSFPLTTAPPSPPGESCLCTVLKHTGRLTKLVGVTVLNSVWGGKKHIHEEIILGLIWYAGFKNANQQVKQEILMLRWPIESEKTQNR